MTKITDSVYAVEVPSMAFGLMVNNYANESELMYMLSMEDIADDDSTEETLITKKLPPGNWRVLCTTREAQDKDTICLKGESIIGLNNLPELLTSKGLDGSKNILLIEKLK